MALAHHPVTQLTISSMGGTEMPRLFISFFMS